MKDSNLVQLLKENNAQVTLVKTESGKDTVTLKEIEPTKQVQT